MPHAMYAVLRLMIVLLLSLTALAPATACHAAPAAIASHCDEPAPSAPTEHRDAALAAPCIGCAAASAVAVPARIPILARTSLANHPAPAPRLAGSTPAPDDRPPRAIA